MSLTPLLLGAVAYDPKVVTIWDGFSQYFTRRGLPFDYVLYTTYERQVESHFAGHIDIAWNSPLAWIQSERIAAQLGVEAQAVCMRDTDRDLTSILIVRDENPALSIADLKGRRIATGARDSPQSTLIPLAFISSRGLEPGRDFEVMHFDNLRGKHGDHIGGERDAVRSVLRGECDAACIIDANHLLFTREGTLAPGSARVIAQTPPYDHCNFTVTSNTPVDSVARFRDLLLEMSYADPEVRPLLDLEGLKKWLPGRNAGYALLSDAASRYADGLNEFVSSVVSRCR
jgi:ABC-type phosphate/phosphonate transport system substrate-binding protein